MADYLKAFASALTTRSVTRLQGVIVQPAGTSQLLAVNVNGNVIPARWIDPLVVSVGDPVAVDFVAGPSGQAEAWVMGRLGPGARPLQGTVATVPVGSNTITLTGSDGLTYTAYFVSSYTPTVGDTVAMYWGAATPTVLGKVGATSAPAPSTPVAPPPSAPQTGTTNYAATDTSTWWGPGGWDSWAGGNNVYQGDYGSGPLTGAWFYAGAASQLAGRTITAVRFNLGARNGAGASSSPVTVNLFTHTSANRPGGNVTLGSGSTQVTAQPYQGSVWYGLPLSFAADLLNGGGIAIANNPYAGFNGRNLEADTGLLSIDWSR